MPRPTARLLVAAAMVSAGGFAAVGAGAHTAYGAPTASDRAVHAVHTTTSGENAKKPKKHKSKRKPPKHTPDLSAAPCGGVRPPKPGGGRYTCTFTDNFNGTALDTSKWMVKETAGSGMTTGDGGCYLAGPDNVSVGGGTLKLTSRVASTPFFCRKGLFGGFTKHSAASVVSYGRFAQTYGRFEFRARFPKTTTSGINSGVWMYPQHQAYGRWPASGEIDVAERFGSSRGDHIYPSLHYAGPGRPRVTTTGQNCRVAKADSSFHDYAVEWTRTSIKFYYDNRLCFTGSWSPAAPLARPQPFDKPFNLVMTQLDGAPGSPPGTHDTLMVDWVRAWR